MKYTIKDLRVDFPDDAACLEWIVNYLHPDGITCIKCGVVTKHHKVSKERAYACDRCGHHMHPTAGTIFHNSHVDLTDWFYAMFLMVNNKAGTSAKQLERELGVAYRTAWRMMHQIRKLMDAPAGQLKTEVEIDETFIHANTFKRSSARRKYGFDARRKGSVVFGILERGGNVKVWQLDGANVTNIMPKIRDHVADGSIIHTDGFPMYKRLPKMGYEHRSTDHSKHEYYTPDSATQSIESFWSTWKPRMKGTFRCIGPKYLQAYANEYAWRYNHRGDVSPYWSLMDNLQKKAN